MLVNNQGLVAVPPQPHQSIKQVPVNSYIPVVQVSCYVFSFGANKRGSPHNSTPVCCLRGLGQYSIFSEEWRGISQLANNDINDYLAVVKTC